MATFYPVLNCFLLLCLNGIRAFGIPYELLLLTESGTLMSFSLENTTSWNLTLSSMKPLPRNISSLEVDEEMIIYHTQAVMTQEFPYSSANFSIVFELGEISSVAVDKQHGNLYFYQPVFQIIGLTTYTKENEFFAYRTILRQVIALIDIATESNGGILFWITNNKTPMIHAAGLLGENPVDIIYAGMIAPASLVVDSNARRIIWFDSAKGTLECSDFYGRKRQVIHQASGTYKGIVPLQENLTLVFDDDSVFLLSESTSWQISLNLNESVQTIASKKTFTTKDTCSKQQCSEMCSLSFGQIQCICYDWHTLQLNNRDCVPPQKYTYSGLFAVVEQQICVTDIAELVKREENDLTFYCLNIARNVTELEMDVRTKTMYYISTKENNWILSRHNLGYDGSFTLTRSNFAIKGLSVNKKDSSLFYGDGYTIKRMKETDISTVVGIDDDVQDLTVDSEKSFLFWVTLKNYYIWRCNTDGSDIRRLIAALNINRLSVFPKQERLFWTAYGGIMSSELNGAIVNVNIVKYGNIREISFYENLGIWIKELDDNITEMCYFHFFSSEKTSCFNITGNASSIYIYDEALKIKDEDFCGTNNGRCGQFCLPYNKTCSCYPGFTLTEDRISCEERHSNNSDVILVDNIMRKIYLLDKRNFQLKSTIETQDTVQSITFDYITGNIYFAFLHTVVEMDIDNNENSTINIQGFDIKHLCVITTSIVFTSEEYDHSSLMSYNKTTGIITTITRDLLEPGDILCDYNSGSVFISERRPIYSIRKIRIAENSTSHIQIGNKQGKYRLALYPTDKVFYCLDTDTSVIYDVTFEGKSGYFFSSSKYKLIEFDVDENFVYGILRQQRFILKINRSDTTLTEIVSVSPLFGLLKFIVLPTTLNHNTDNSTSLIQTKRKTPDTSSNIPAIIIPIVCVLVVTICAAICFKFRKHIKTLRFGKERESIGIFNSTQFDERPVSFTKRMELPDVNLEESPATYMKTEDIIEQEEKNEAYDEAENCEDSYNSGSTLSYSYAGDGAPDISFRVSIRAPPDD